MSSKDDRYHYSRSPKRRGVSDKDRLPEKKFLHGEFICDAASGGSVDFAIQDAPRTL